MGFLKKSSLPFYDAKQPEKFINLIALNPLDQPFMPFFTANTQARNGILGPLHRVCAVSGNAHWVISIQTSVTAKAIKKQQQQH